MPELEKSRNVSVLNTKPVIRLLLQDVSERSETDKLTKKSFSSPRLKEEADLVALSTLPPKEMTLSLGQALQEFYKPKGEQRGVAMGRTERTLIECMREPKKVKEMLEHIITARPIQEYTTAEDWMSEVKDRMRLMGIHGGVIRHLSQRNNQNEIGLIQSQNIVSLVHLFPWQVQQNLNAFLGYGCVDSYAASLLVLMGGLGQHGASDAGKANGVHEFTQELCRANQKGIKEMIDHNVFSDEFPGSRMFVYSLTKLGTKSISEVWSLWESYELQELIREKKSVDFVSEAPTQTLEIDDPQEVRASIRVRI